MNTLLPRWLVLLAVLPLAGCADQMMSSDGGEDPVDREETFPVEVTTADGATFRGQSLEVNVFDGPDGGVQVRVEGLDEEAEPGWSASGSATLEDLDAGKFTFDLKMLPLTPGIGNATRWLGGVDDLVPAEQGTMTIDLGQDHEAEGSASAVPEAAGATFSGPFVVNCWVAPAALGQPDNGYGDPGGKERVQDVDFESEFCQRFLAWR